MMMHCTNDRYNLFASTFALALVYALENIIELKLIVFGGLRARYIGFDSIRVVGLGEFACSSSNSGLLLHFILEIEILPPLDCKKSMSYPSERQ